MQKKHSIFLLILFCTAFLHAQSAYFTGNGGQGKNVLIYRSTIENAGKSENYIAAVIKDSFKTVLTRYSNLNVLDATQAEDIKKIQKKSSDLIESGKIYNAKTVISIVTTKNSGGKFNISVSVNNAETARNEGGYTSSVWYTEDEYLQKAANEAAAEILPLLGVKLTNTGKQMILGRNFDGSQDYSAQNLKEQLEAINTELSRIENQYKKSSSKTEEDFTRAQAQKQILLQQKINAENELKKQEENSRRKMEESRKNAKRDAQTKEQLSKMSQSVEEKAREIRNKKTQGLTPLQKISVIENEKSALLASNMSIQKTIEDYNKSIDAECEKKILERKNQPIRKAELDTKTNGLNNTGRQILMNDIEKIRSDYKKMKDDNEAQIRNMTEETNAQLRSKITDDIRALEGETYTADSLTDKSVYLLIDSYDGDKKGWVFSISFDFAGTKLLTSKGILKYEEVTGEKIPDLNDYILRERYNTNVENYDNYFSTTRDFVQARVYYRIKAKASAPSTYTVSAAKLEFFKLTDTKRIKKISLKNSYDYTYYPVTDVDWKTGGRKFTDSTRNFMTATENTAGSAVSGASSWIKSNSELQEGKDTMTAWNFIPTDVSFIYTSGGWTGISFGYSGTWALTPNVFYGGNFNLGMLSKYEDGNDITDYFATIDALLGCNYNFTEKLRCSMFAEAGLVTNGLGAGGGISFDYSFSQNICAAGGYSCIYTSSYNTEHAFKFSIATKVNPVTYFSSAADNDW